MQDKYTKFDKIEETFRQFKEGNYQFGMYNSKNDIKEAFNEGKIFVLKGGLNSREYFQLVFVWGCLFWILIGLLITMLPNYGFYAFKKLKEGFSDVL